MNAYRIQNDLVAARDEQEAIAAWAKHYDVDPQSAGPVEQIDPSTFIISVENEDGTWRDAPVAEVMPTAGEACLVAFGEHDC